MIKIWLCLLYLLNCWFFSNHYKPECSLKKTWLLHSRSRSQRRVTVSVFIQMVSSKSCRPAFITKLEFCDVSSWAGLSCEKIGLLFLRSRSLQELNWWKYDIFCYIFWTADPFAIKHFYLPPPPSQSRYKYRGNGVYWNYIVCLSILSVCPSLCVSDFVWTISP